MEKETRQKQRSRMIQEGTYGCAFTPALPCRKSKLKGRERSRSVGKIIRLKNAEIELSIGALIQGIPGYERYFIVQEVDECDSKNMKAIRREYGQECEIFKKRKDRELDQILSGYGGRTLSSYSLSSRFDYMGAFQHMLEGLSLLAKQGICHMDLHESNVLVDAFGALRMIDFGASFLGDKTNAKEVARHQYSFSPSFGPQPPELAVQNGLNDEFPLSYAIQQTFEQKKIFSLASGILGMDRNRQISDLYSFWSEKGLEEDGWIPFYKEHWRKWDAWAVGVMFLKLLQKMLLFPSFSQTVWKKEGRKIKLTLAGLLQADPRKRFTCELALNVLNGQIGGEENI